MERRRFCSVLAATSTVAVPSPVSAQSNIQITGTINSAIGADVGGIELFFQHVETGSSFTYTVPESGDIDFTVSEAGTHRVRLFNTSNRNDNVPLVYSFGQQNIVEGGNSFNFTIPQSYETQIQCIDSTGDPVERLSVTLRADGTSPGTNFTTSKQGYVKFQTTTETKLQLAGLTEVEVESTTSDNRQILDTINVTEPTVAELTVRDPEEFTYNFKLVEADPEAGFYHPYLLYRPNLKQDSERPLYVEPLNAPAVSDRKELHNQLISSLDGKTFAGARRNEYPGIIAGFPRTENDGPDHIQTLTLPSYRPELFTSHYRLDNLATKEFSAKSLTRVDKQLLAMIEDAKSRLQSESYSIADKVHMSAFSGGGHFCNRFAFLHPTEVRTLTTGAADILPLPKNSHDATVLPYPLGTADYEELTGREFNKEAWAKINRYIYIGGDDQPTPETDPRGYYNTIRYPNRAETVFGVKSVDERFPFVESQYSKVTDNAEFQIFDGVGHTVTQKMEDTLSTFHRKNAPVNDTQISNVRIDPSVIRQSRTHTLTFNVSNLSSDGEKDEFAIEIPETVDIKSVDNVTADLLSDPDYKTAGNNIIFSINPTGAKIGIVEITVEMTLSQSNY